MNIGSVLALIPSTMSAAYSGSKAFVLNFTRALHDEISAAGAVAQVVMPGPIRSEFFGEAEIPFPEHMIMEPADVVDVALKALDRGEMVCWPSLGDGQAWDRYEVARGAMVQSVIASGRVPERYA